MNDAMKKERFRSFLGKYGIIFVMLIMMVAIGIMEPAFFSSANFLSVAAQVSINGMIAYGMCLVITAGGIDLSVGAQLAWISCVLGVTITKMGWPLIPAILVALIVSTLFGVVNGFLVAQFNMFPFVVTLSTQLVIRGLSQVISNGQAITLESKAFKNIYSVKVGPVPFPFVLLLIVSVLMYILLHWTKFGRYIFAVGGNPNAAVASGVSKYWITIGVYTISGLMAGIAALLFTAKTGTAQSNIGVGYETDAIAACVLGGTSFTGGIATIPGVFVGIFIIGFIYNGMNMIGVSSYYQSIVKGCVIIGAVLLDMVMSRKNSR